MEDSRSRQPRSPLDRRTILRRVVAASLVGSALEWYDFFIYGTAAALVFGKLFFPVGRPSTGTILAFAAFSVGFVFRPLGGFLFGHMGDRVGRRATLVATTLVMGLSTTIIGLLPTYASVGVLAPALLVLMRIFQGLGAGAEFGGASTLLGEHAPQARRGFFTSFAQTGVQIGLLTGTGAFLLAARLPTQAFESWGWRLPFLVSFLLIGVALWVRLRVAESPVFEDMVRTRKTVRLPAADALRRYPRSFLIGVGAHISDMALVYTYSTFAVAYIAHNLALPTWVGLTAVVLAAPFVIVLQPVYGALSDRVGRRPVNIFSVVATAVLAYPFFLVLDTRVPGLIWLAFIVITVFGFAPMIAVQPSFYAELFGAKVRYTGFAASREIGAAVGGFAPLIAAALVRQAGGASWPVAALLVVAALISLVAFLFSRETKDIDITAFDITEATAEEVTRGRAA